MSRPHIGQYAPLPRPTPRRLSDIHPYARLATPRDPDRAVGYGLTAVALALVVLIVLGVVPL